MKRYCEHSGAEIDSPKDTELEAAANKYFIDAWKSNNDEWSPRGAYLAGAEFQKQRILGMLRSDLVYLDKWDGSSIADYLLKRLEDEK